MMFDKDPKQIIQFVLIFLPGFLCLALANSIVDFEFTEFEYAYMGVALSIAIFISTYLIGRLIGFSTAENKRSGESDEDYNARRTGVAQWWMIGLVLPITFTFAWLLGITVQNDLITASMHAITPAEILKQYRGRPQYVVFKSHHDCKMWQHDSRPADIVGKDGKAMVYPSTHKNWIRIRGEKAGIYEGFPETFQISGKEAEYYLSPACRIKTKNDKEIADIIPGPGVLVLGKDILAIEFIDTRDSQCYFEFYRTNKTVPCE